MMAFTRRIEEVERKEKAVKAVSEAGALSTQLYGRGGHGTEKVGEKRRFRDTGGVEEGACTGLLRGRAVRWEGQEERSSKTRGGKKPSTHSVSFEARLVKSEWTEEEAVKKRTRPLRRL
jgi:hypothetical protein